MRTLTYLALLFIGFGCGYGYGALIHPVSPGPGRSAGRRILRSLAELHSADRDTGWHWFEDQSPVRDRPRRPDTRSLPPGIYRARIPFTGWAADLRCTRIQRETIHAYHVRQHRPWPRV